MLILSVLYHQNYIYIYIYIMYKNVIENKININKNKYFFKI